MTITDLDPQDRPRAARPAVLEARGLCVAYGEGPEGVGAVTDVDLVLRRGEVLGLAGESGSGKSTLAYAMTRLLRAPGVITGGDVIFHDARSPEARSRCSTPRHGSCASSVGRRSPSCSSPPSTR
jgi:ABC-type glutathione transport system ATPase component